MFCPDMLVKQSPLFLVEKLDGYSFYLAGKGFISIYATDSDFVGPELLNSGGPLQEKEYKMIIAILNMNINICLE